MAAAKRPPVIVVPGIKGSGLEDYYPIARQELWSAVLTKEYERVAMHPDDLRYEALEPAQVRASSPFAIAYKELIEALRYELTPDSRKPVPVFAFGYDWRQDCLLSAAQLGAMIEEVLARTRLLPHYRDDPPSHVDVVAHSMGGIVVGLLLAERGAKARIRRVVTLGAPLRGAIDACSMLAMGQGNFWGEVSREREREAARSMPSVYHLLPWFEGAVVSDDPVLRDLYDPRAWQRSIVQTLDSYCRRVKADTTGPKLLGNFLTSAQKAREKLESIDLRRALPEGRKGWLPIAGADEVTALSVENVREGNTPRFRFSAPANGWPESATGDGTVPLPSTVPPFLDASWVVCITPRDFSFWELGDRALMQFGGFHASLPVMNLAQRLAIRFLRPDYRGRVWGRPYPGVTRPSWPDWLEEPR